MPDSSFPLVATITDLQIDLVHRWHQESIQQSHTGWLDLISQQHESNFRLWHQEDEARVPAATDTQIANVKRAIDRLNQIRNDQIETIDIALAELLTRDGITPDPDAPINTETPGSAIDRLSIMSLRLFHYREELRRDGTTNEHNAKVAERIEACERQHADLSTALQTLLGDLFAGRKRQQIYRQMKMYNDPSLNPSIYEANG